MLRRTSYPSSQKWLAVLIFSRVSGCRLIACLSARVGSSPVCVPVCHVAACLLVFRLFACHARTLPPVTCLSTVSSRVSLAVCCLSFVCLVFSSVCLLVCVFSYRSSVCRVFDRLPHCLSFPCISTSLRVFSSWLLVCRVFAGLRSCLPFCLFDCLSCLRLSTWPRDWLSVSQLNTRPSVYHMPSPSLQR